MKFRLAYSSHLVWHILGVVCGFLRFRWDLLYVKPVLGYNSPFQFYGRPLLNYIRPLVQDIIGLKEYKMYYTNYCSPSMGGRPHGILYGSVTVGCNFDQPMFRALNAWENYFRDSRWNITRLRLLPLALFECNGATDNYMWARNQDISVTLVFNSFTALQIFVYESTSP